MTPEVKGQVAPGLEPVRDAFAEVLGEDPVGAALAAARPSWEPGTRHGEHALTFGDLVGEVARRVDGRSVGAASRSGRYGIGFLPAYMIDSGCDDRLEGVLRECLGVPPLE